MKDHEPASEAPASEQPVSEAPGRHAVGSRESGRGRQRAAIVAAALALAVLAAGAAHAVAKRLIVVRLDPERYRATTERAVRVALSAGRHEILVASFHEGLHFGRLDFHASGLPVRVHDNASGWTSYLLLPTATLPSAPLALDLPEGGFVEAFVMAFPDAHGSFTLRVDGWPHEIDLEAAALDPSAALQLGGPDDSGDFVLDEGFERPLYAMVVKGDRLVYRLLDRGTTGSFGVGDAETRVWYFYVREPAPRNWPR